MPGKTEFNLKPWEERIGLDASVVHCTGGKRQINRDQKTVSQVPLPLEQGKTPFLCEMPLRNSEKDPSVDTDVMLWRTYRSLIKNPDDMRDQGKKMHAHKIPSNEYQAMLRKGLRDHMRQAVEEEAALKEEQHRERERVKERHLKRKQLELDIFRARCKDKGFEGLRRPWFKAQPPEPPIPTADVEALMKVPFQRSGGKKMMTDHLASIDNGPPFGPPLRSESEPMRRWESKTFT